MRFWRKRRGCQARSSASFLISYGRGQLLSSFRTLRSGGQCHVDTTGRNRDDITCKRSERKARWAYAWMWHAASRKLWLNSCRRGLLKEWEKRVQPVHLVVSTSVCLYSTGIIVTLSLFFVEVSWFPKKSNVHPIVQRTRIIGKSSKTKARFRMFPVSPFPTSEDSVGKAYSVYEFGVWIWNRRARGWVLRQCEGLSLWVWPGDFVSVGEVSQYGEWDECCEYGCWFGNDQAESAVWHFISKSLLLGCSFRVSRRAFWVCGRKCDVECSGSGRYRAWEEWFEGPPYCIIRCAIHSDVVFQAARAGVVILNLHSELTTFDF